MNSTAPARIWHPDGWRDGSLPPSASAAPLPRTGAPSHDRARLVPGIANLHSHAFQRAMAGMAERQTHPQDSFWTWRETMYRFADRFTPQTLRAVAAQLYAEMLEAGYTTVCEFHYLHHAPGGTPYADPAEMSWALVEAAAEVGIRLTLLPVLYMTGGFDGRALEPRQQRFGHDVEGYLDLLERLRAKEHGLFRVGCALHSLRAVPGAAMREVVDALPADSRIHIHIAEQLAEVDECVRVRGVRPVQWLLEHARVDARWTLVHATHLDDAELAGVAASQATVAICPTTEANLGDGLFRLRDFIDAGGRWGVGSDSNVSVSPVEELRWLEYGQRLVTRRRNIAVGPASTSVGETLLRGVLASAVAATGHPLDASGAAWPADVVVLDTDAPQLAGATDDDTVDQWLFSGNRSLVRQVRVDGRCVVDAGRHVDADAIATRYRDALAVLLAHDR